MTNVLTFSENSELAGELVTAASSLLPSLGGRAMDIEVDSVREDAARGTVLLIKGAAQISGDHELIATALSEATKEKSPGGALVLIGSTRLGRMVAARLAVLAKMNVLADVRGLKTDGTKLSGVRGAYAGKFSATVEAPLPCIALVTQGAYETGGSLGPVEEMSVQVAARVKRTELPTPQRSQTDLRGAKVIVAAGRGFKTKEDLALVQKLADALGGAMGASRPLSSDLGWLGEEYHIGLTGIYVRPDLYLAVGISGQLQHVAGIKDSKVIAAINRDKQAPIFQVADYGIVGDLYEVVPALLRRLGSERAGP